MKNKILHILCAFILISLIFIINNSVFATEIDTLIVNGYDMSDVYNYFSKEDAFFIVDWGNYGNEYYLAVPGRSGYRSYCAISSVNSCLYYNENWEALDGHSYQFYKFNLDTLKFEKSWYGHLNDWTLDNGTLYFAYASKGIYNQDHETFFFKTPVTEQPETIPETVEIPAVETVEQIPTAMVETLKMIIPVGLVILSVVLLIYLMRLLIFRFS